MNYNYAQVLKIFLSLKYKEIKEKLTPEISIKDVFMTIIVLFTIIFGIPISLGILYVFGYAFIFLANIPYTNANDCIMWGYIPLLAIGSLIILYKFIIKPFIKWIHNNWELAKQMSIKIQ